MKGFHKTTYHSKKPKHSNVHNRETGYSKKKYLKNKSETTNYKTKIYQNTFSSLGYKLNHKISHLKKYLKNKGRKKDGKAKTRPLIDKDKRRQKENRRKELPPGRKNKDRGFLPSKRLLPLIGPNTVKLAEWKKHFKRN